MDITINFLDCENGWDMGERKNSNFEVDKNIKIENVFLNNFTKCTQGIVIFQAVYRNICYFSKYCQKFVVEINFFI